MNKPLILGVLLALSASGQCGSIPPFHVNGHISLKAFRPKATEAYHAEEADVSFYHSNGWWSVEAHYIDPGMGELEFKSCMSIPDGVRVYRLFQSDMRNGKTVADVCGISYPPPGARLLFDTWLALCPNPKLPVMDENSTRRFVNVPTCWPGLFEHEENVGTYKLTWLEKERPFISRFVITNNGVYVGLGSGNKSEIRVYPAPFDKGFVEFDFEVMNRSVFSKLI